jgi:hypothetical protein
MKTSCFQIRALLMAVTLVIGVTAAISFVVLFVVGIYRGTFVSQDDLVMVSFHGDGEPYLTRIVWSQSYRTFTNLEGKPITLTDETEYVVSASLSAAYPRPFHGDQADWQDRIVGFLDNGQPPNYWYLVTDGRTVGHGWFVGYSAANHRQVGYIGREGFRETPIPPVEQFPLRSGFAWNQSQLVCRGGVYSRAVAPQGLNRTANGQREFLPWVVFLNSGSTVYAVDLATRQVSTVVADLKEPVVSLDTGGRANSTTSKNWLAMRSADAIRLFSPAGELETLPVGPQLVGRNIEIVERADGTYTVVAGENLDYVQQRQLDRIYILAADGTLSDPRETFVSMSLPPDSRSYEAALVEGSPAYLLFSLARFRTDELRDRDMADNWGSAFQLALRQYALYLLATIVAGAILAGLAFRRQVLYQTSPAERIFWPLFVFFLGLPSWIGYRYCRKWPPLVVCPACHAAAPGASQACALCEQEFPLPEVKGTEIFA